MINPASGNILDLLLGAVKRAKIKPFSKVPELGCKGLYEDLARSWIPINPGNLIAQLIWFPIEAITTVTKLAQSIIAKIQGNHELALDRFSEMIDHGIIFTNLALNLSTLGLLNCIILKTERAYNNLTWHEGEEHGSTCNISVARTRDYWNNLSFAAMLRSKKA